jgi:hypothetical protein
VSAGTGKRCECPHTGEVAPEDLDQYDETTERPFVNHKPNECACTNDLKLYETCSGEHRWLCSVCVMFGDEELSLQ